MSKSFCFTSNISYYLGLNGFLFKPEALFGFAQCYRTTLNLNKESYFELINGLNGYYPDMMYRLSIVPGLLWNHRKSESIREIIENKTFRPILCVIDDFYIEYHPYYQKYHYKRPVVLLSLNKDEVFIYDDGKHKMQFTNFIKAIGVPVVFYTFNEYIGKISKKEIIKIVQKTCEMNLHSHSNANIHKGPVAFANLFEYLKEVVIKMDDIKFKQLMNDLHFQLNRNGGISSSRYLFGSFLIWFGNAYNDNNIIQFGNEFIELSDSWETSGNLFFKSAFLVKPEFIFKNIHPFFDRCLKKEIFLLNRLLKYID